MSEPDYETTRAAWRDIWSRADITAELQTRTYARSQAIRARFLPRLPKDCPILEAGCGLGVELIGLADAAYRAVGLDYVQSAVTRLKSHRPDLRLAAGDVHALPFRNGAFGAYLSFGVLEHFAFGPEPALREASRVLRPDGVLVVTVPAPNLVWRLARLKERWWGRPKEDGATYYETAYSASSLERFVTAAGFEILERESVGHDFTLWGCGKIFRGPGYYQTNGLAQAVGSMLARLLPQSMSFATLVVARKMRPR
jgi:SAM-dependent methyltransferase